MKRGRGTTLSSRWPVLIAVVVALIVVVASVAYVAETDLGNSSSSPPTLGPGISISVTTSSVTLLSSMPLSAELANVTVQIFSFVPGTAGYTAVNLTGTNLSSNPYLDELFQGTPNAAGVVAGNLSYAFYALDHAWLSTMSPMTQTVSLQLYATLAVTQNGLTEQYTYFNNIPYNPRAPPLDFSAAVSFPSHPTFTGPSLATASSAPALVPAERPPPSCDPGYYWDPKNSTLILNGIIPLAIVNGTDTPSGTILSYGLDYARTALQMSFTSDTEWSNYTAFSGVQMSSTPSWSGNDTTFQGDNVESGTVSGLNTTYIGLGGAELYVVNYQEAHVWGTYPNCYQAWVPGKTSTDVSVYGFESGSNWDFVTGKLPMYWGNLTSQMTDWQVFASDPIVYGGGGLDLYTVLESATAYQSAQNAEAQAAAALSTFGLALGTALAVCAVTGLIPGLGDVSDAAEAIAVLSDLTGVAAGLMFLMSSISFSMTEKTSIQQFGININPDGTQTNVDAAFYEATKAGQLTIGSNSYYPQMPLVYVVVT